MNAAASDPDRPRLRLVERREPSRPRAAGLRPEGPACDDSELLTAVRAGDRSAALAFHDRVRPQIERTTLRLLGRGDPDREDCAQLALLELVRSIHRFRGDCSLDAFTATVAARVVYKAIRRRRTERRYFVSAQGSEPEAAAPAARAEAPGASPLRGAGLREAVVRIRAHLAELEPARSWAFLLHDVWGYDLREMASIMDVSVAAAQSRLVRGRRDLHERIGRDPELAGVLRELGGDR